MNIIKSEDLDEYLYPRKKRIYLIILDTNKKELVQSKEVLNKIENKLIIDHHDLGKTTIKDAIIIDDNKVSSTCEMITKFNRIL